MYKGGEVGNRRNNSRIMHAVIENVCGCIGQLKLLDMFGRLQKVNAPAIIPFAIAAGNKACPSRVKGVDKKMKRGGGITRRKLSRSLVLKYAVVVQTYRSMGR